MNHRSRSRSRWGLLLFTLVTLASLPALQARADRVAVYPFTGRADEARNRELEQLVAEILREQGHTVVTPVDRQHPSGSEAMERAAAGARANYVLVAEIEPMPGQYRFHVHVYYRPGGRVEELVVTVLNASERERLSDVLSSMVRTDGLGEDAVRLTEEEDDEARARREAAERARQEAEEQARREEEERQRAEEEAARRAEEEEAARREAEERRQAQERAQQAWNSRPRYGQDGPWMVQAYVGGKYAGALGGIVSMAQTGGGLFELGLRLGRTIPGVEGLEFRGGLDFTTGTFSAIGIHVGAVWAGSFLTEPIFMGFGGEVGALFTVTGSRDVGFSGRVMGVFAWRPIEHLYFEVSIPELGIVTPGTGALTVGASVRGGYRF